MTHYGKYRGTVLSNHDPQQLGRLQLSVPDVYDLSPSAWALPCLPPGVSSLPEVGGMVWVEFEQGDLARPLWCGVFWTDVSRVPAALRSATPATALSLLTRDGGGLLIDPAGISIDNGKGARIVLTGPSVSINRGALDIT